MYGINASEFSYGLHKSALIHLLLILLKFIKQYKSNYKTGYVYQACLLKLIWIQNLLKMTPANNSKNKTTLKCKKKLLYEECWLCVAGSHVTNV